MTETQKPETELALRPIQFTRALTKQELGILYDLQLQIDDKIDEWHASKSNLQLHEFLNMSLDDYKLFVEDPSAYFDKRLKEAVKS